MTDTCRSARLSLAYSNIGHATMHIMTVLYLTVVLELAREWQADYQDLIQLWTVGSLLVGLGAPLAGWLGDRWSDARMMVLMFLFSGIGALGAALSKGPEQMMLALAVIGLGGSIYHPVGISWTMKNAENRGRSMGILGIFGSVGVAGGGVVAGGLTALWGWHAAFLVPGLVSLLFAAALAWHIAQGQIIDRKADMVKSLAPTRRDIVRAFIIMSVTMMCGGMIFQSLLTVAPKWFEQAVGADLSGSVVGVGGLVTLVFLAGAIPQFLGGVLADRFPVKWLYIGCAFLQVPFYLIAMQFMGWSSLALAIALVTLMNVQIPAENLLLARFTPARYRGIAYGSKFVLSFGMAPFAVQLVAWSYGHDAGPQMVFATLAVLSALVLVAAMLLPRDDKGQEPPVTDPAKMALAGGDD
ncbi:MFS transporter [Niveispirillum lacus]|uniref:MFS transporter n=1 Tax=Niveispirillum lacus TaxID=1981099 RepID=A0A255YY07_9PROT|nr:MFS transporter [Niveispirillum lacus]OYQ34117.1 MFS transporter [Niveispirillum lacus]